MDIYSTYKKLDKGVQQKLLLELCQAIVSLKNPKEAAQLLADLLSSQELMMVAKRLQIAKFLIKEENYEKISKELKTSPITIAKINAWLYEAGDGYRLAVGRLKDKKTSIPEEIPMNGSRTISYSGWSDIKRRYPIYFWPERVISDIVRSINNKQRKRLLETLRILDKTKLKKITNKKYYSTI